MATTNESANVFKTILWAGLLVGTLDISAAIINYMIGGGREPIKIFVYIASGVFGKEAFSAGSGMALWGLAFHYLIAYSFTTAFLLVYPRVPILSSSRLATGLVYGLLIWAVMNLIVLPMANTPKGPFNLRGAIVGSLILVTMIGLPLSFIASWLYNKRSAQV